MFSCEFCDVSEHTFFTKHLWATASWRSANQKHSLVNIFWKKKRKNFMRESFLVTLQGCSLQFSLKEVSILRVLLETFNKVYKQLLHKLYCVNQTGFEIRKKYWTTKTLARQVSHEFATGENIFHFRYSFDLKSQSCFWCKSYIKKSSEMISFHDYLTSL